MALKPGDLVTVQNFGNGWSYGSRVGPLAYSALLRFAPLWLWQNALTDFSHRRFARPGGAHEAHGWFPQAVSIRRKVEKSKISQSSAHD